MEWKPDKTSKTELERKQSEYARKALDMAKRSQTRQMKPNSDKEINIIQEKAPENYKPTPETAIPQATEIKPQTTPETVKAKPEEIIIHIEKEKPEAAKPKVIIPERVEEPEPSTVFIKSVKEAQINANFNIKGKIYKKPPEIQPYEEGETIPETAVETDGTVCAETTDNPFGTVKPQKTEAKCTPPNFKEYIKQHNEQHGSCNKCCPPKKKWN